MIRLVQPGSGPDRDLIVAYHVGAFDALRAAAWSDACVLADVSGRYQAPRRLDVVEQLAHELAPGAWRIRHRVLVAWSMGCVGPRELLRGGARPDVVVALDGTAGAKGSAIPSDHYVMPWRELAERARRGECLAVLAHTYQTYTERLPSEQRFPSTVRVLRMATGWPLERGGPATAPVETVEGGLVVASYASASIDAQAHVDQVAIALPDLFARHVRAPRTHDRHAAPRRPRDLLVAGGRWSVFCVDSRGHRDLG